MYTFKLKHLLIICIVLSTSLFAAKPDDKTDKEDVQKVNIISYLVSTVKWPKCVNCENILNVCVLGKFSEMKLLDQMNGKVIDAHKVVVKKFPKQLQKTDNCHIIYITKSAQDQSSNILQQFSTSPVLLLSDDVNFAKDGGSMNFISIKEIVGLTINVESLKKSNLSMKLSTYNPITVIPENQDLELRKNR